MCHTQHQVELCPLQEESEKGVGAEPRIQGLQGLQGACDLSLLAGFELVTVWKAERGPGDSNKLLPVLVWHRRAVLERLIRIMQFSFCRIESRDEGSSLVGHQSPGFFLASPPLTTFQTYTQMSRVGKEIKDTKRRQLGCKPQNPAA